MPIVHDPKTGKFSSSGGGSASPKHKIFGTNKASTVGAALEREQRLRLQKKHGVKLQSNAQREVGR